MDRNERVGRCIALKISTTSKAEYVSFPRAKTGLVDTSFTLE
jgi:hypothetical protein